MEFVCLGSRGFLYIDRVVLVKDPHATSIMLSQAPGRKECEITMLVKNQFDSLH